ncbi:MAG: efflux RND transporter permease subunit [Bacteroidales bacterium]|nr:efflux RND transporter permease subunit [Bacteroidales bacterium]
MLDKFIERPVLSTVISVIIVIFGIVGLFMLPVENYPDIAPPMIRVSATYPGANADVVLKSVVAPLEEQINGVEGMDYISSSAKDDGSAEISVYFHLGVDPDMANVYVQNRVSAATSQLPKSVIDMGVTTTKMQNSMVLMVTITSTNPNQNETFLQNYTRINILPAMQRVNGVGQVSVFGSRQYAMRVWLLPDKLASYSLQPSDVISAIQEQSIEVAPGKFGSNTKEAFEYTIKYKGRFSDVQEYENIVVRADKSGQVLYLKDVAKIEFGAFDYSVETTSDGRPATAMAVYQTKGSNSKVIIEEITKILEEQKQTFPPGMEYKLTLNTDEFLDASISLVIDTLRDAFILVLIVVLLFLQNLKSTVIPAISAFVAIVGAFSLLYLFGFSINLLTLFALVLSIGIVVDDAIVVVEAVYSKLEAGASSSMEATKQAMNEISGAIVSITIVFMAVFIPVSFMSGATGAFYKQFAITLSMAVLISALNALTLSPALCALLIKPQGAELKKGLIARFFKAFNIAFEAFTAKYLSALKYLLHHKWLTGGVFAVILAMAAFLMYKTPSAFIPTEDQGNVFYDVTLPNGATLDRTQAVLMDIDSALSVMPVIDQKISIAGVSMLSGANGGSYGLGVIKLINWDRRDTTNLTKIYQEIVERTAFVKEGIVTVFLPPTVPGYGNSNGFTVQMLDKTGGSLQNMYDVSEEFLAALRKRPEIDYVASTFSVNFPQYEMIVDIAKCKIAGVAVGDIFAAMQSYYGGQYVDDFNRFTKFYRVMVQAEPEVRKDLKSINEITVRNSNGDMVPISTMATFNLVYGSDMINRFNLFSTVTVNGAPKAGYSSGEAIQAIRETASEVLPSGYSYEFSGLTRDEVAAGSKTVVIFVLSIVLVYFILCGLYESYIIPWSVILSLGLGVFGVFVSANIFGIDNNIYVQIALIMLNGLLAKNAILIVEYAMQRRAEGMSILEAATTAAHQRLRPILMTSFAFVVGLLPLTMARGAGAAGDVSIGISAAGGFFIATFLGVLVVPVLFVVFKTLDERISTKSIKK